MSDTLTDPEANAVIAGEIVLQLDTPEEILLGMPGEFSFTIPNGINIAVKVEWRGRKVTVFETRPGQQTVDCVMSDPGGEDPIVDTAVMFINYLASQR